MPHSIAALSFANTIIGFGHVNICNSAPQYILPWKTKLVQMDLFIFFNNPSHLKLENKKRALETALSLVCLYCIRPDMSLLENKLIASLGKSVTLWIIYQSFPRLKNKHLLINTKQLKSWHCCITSWYVIFLCCSSCARKNWTIPHF